MFAKINYQQDDDYCVLASYAVAIEDILGIPIQTCFEEYCEYFKVHRHEFKVERDYLRHFKQEQDRRSGYSIVKEFHEHANTPNMTRIRERITIQPVNMKSEKAEIERALQTSDSRLMVFINRRQDTRFKSHHSITVGFNGIAFITYDVNGGLIHAIDNIEGIGEIGDCLLLTKNTPATILEEK